MFTTPPDEIVTFPRPLVVKLPPRFRVPEPVAWSVPALLHWAELPPRFTVPAFAMIDPPEAFVIVSVL